MTATAFHPDLDGAGLSLIIGIDAYRAAVPTVIPWVCRPLAYLGGVTLISGPPKAGKSTMAAQLQRCRETGDRLFGMFPVATGPTLLVTEEGGAAVVHKTDGLHALEVLDRRSAVGAGLTFAQVLDLITSWGEAHPDGLVFIDTLAIWAGIEDENDAGQATKAIAAITVLAQSTNVAIVLIHHSRKSGGDNGEAIRGSGAILATVDIAVELSRVKPEGDDRWLDIQGRVILPERFRLAFDRDALAYSLIDQTEARLTEIEHDIASIPADGPGLSSTDLRNLWQVDPRKRSEHLLDVGRLRREWAQTGRVHGWRYWSIPAAIR
jgi:RecA-family ATPase